MENAEDSLMNGDNKTPEEGKNVNGDLKSADSRGKCGKCTKSRAGKEVPAAKQQQSKIKVDDGTKSLELLKKSLGAVNSPDEKVTLICEKYAELLEDNRKLALAVKQGEKKAAIIQKEKELAQAEHSKGILTRGRLENLCRELQHQNKAIKEESLNRIKDEEEKRKELSARFNVTLNEITTLMHSNTEKNNQLREENKALADKFKVICEQYELRESQVTKLMQQSELENKLAETKIAKVQVEMMTEKEILLRELSSYQTQLKQMTENETALRGQITMYSDKYEEFQGALTRSNEVFNSFKAEMEKMSKKIIRLEKETSSWKSRWEKSHQALLEMAADKQQRDEELIRAGKQVSQLQRLCRTLQDERSKHIAKLREFGEDFGKNQTTPHQKEEIEELLVNKPKSPMPMPVIESEPINIVEDNSEPSEPEKIVSQNGVETAAKELTEKNSSVENSTSTNASDIANNTNEPVPDNVPEKPSAETAAKQTTPTPDKKKAKEGGRKKKK